ncbi:MAG: FecR domain-containing protein [Polyangiaceae bacterium]|nr:FecR domain-containing protein [Polyangiaceae bacterium]
MKNAKRLAFPLNSQLVDPATDAAVRRVKLRVFSALGAAPTPTVWSWGRVGFAFSGALLVAALAVVGFQYFGVRSTSSTMLPGPLLTRSGSAFEALSTSPHSVAHTDFSDGSRIELAPAGKVSALSSTAQEFSVLLEQGELHVHVVPGGPRRWVVEAKLARIEVVGTDFSVQRSANSVRVSVGHGVVLVRSAWLEQGVQRLTAGQQLEVSPATSGAAESSPHGAKSPIRPIGHAAPKTIQPLEHAAAELPLVPRHRTSPPSVNELFAAVDRARLAGNRAEAEAALQQILSQFPNDARAPVARYTLGLVRLSAGGDRRRAVAEFELVLESGASSSLREDAFAKLVEVHAAAGEASEARSLLLRYQDEFPQGRHLARLRAKLRATRTKSP